MIYIVGTTGKHGGPAKFKDLFINFMIESNIDFKYDIEGLKFSFIRNTKRFLIDTIFIVRNRKRINLFIINGTSRILIQLLAKSMRIPITIRLDGYKHYEIKDLVIHDSLIALIRKYIVNINIILSDKIVFQSTFIKQTYFDSNLRNILLKRKNKVILNPCKLNFFERKIGNSILCVEGNVGGIYSNQLLNILQKFKSVCVVGDVSSEEKIEGIKYLGRLEKNDLINLFKQNWFAYFPLEPFPPCPNSMIEAITYGIPIIASFSGSNPEILENSDLIFSVPFGWKDELLNIRLDENAIKEKIELLESNWTYYSRYSNKLSEKFESNKILNEYLNFILDGK